MYTIKKLNASLDFLILFFKKFLICRKFNVCLKNCINFIFRSNNYILFMFYVLNINNVLMLYNNK